MMKVVQVKKSYGTGSSRVEVLKGVSLELQKGDSLALLGKSGSGKSTLLSLLAGLDGVDSGQILINDQDIGKMSESQLTQFRAHNIGIVFQQFHLVSTLTAFENVLLPLQLIKLPDAHKRAEELLSKVGLSHRSHHLPSELSGGECQRVAIARALAISPTVLFADEPSGNLDEETGEMVMKLLFDMVKATHTTLVLVTHDQELAQRCSRVIHLEHGSLV